MARYQIHMIADANCTAIHPEVVANTDDRREAGALAADYYGNVYGTAIVDTYTSEVDWGHC